MIAGSWLIASVLTVLITARSSTMPAVCGSNSLTQAPCCPCCRNLNLDGAMGNRFCPDVIVVIRWPLRIESGRSLSNQSFIFGL